MAFSKTSLFWILLTHFMSLHEILKGLRMRFRISGCEDSRAMASKQLVDWTHASFLQKGAL